MSELEDIRAVLKELNFADNSIGYSKARERGLIITQEYKRLINNMYMMGEINITQYNWLTRDCFVD